jgi:hypothetical protein
MIYKTLNVSSKTYVFDREANAANKVLLFLAGMRGSGKTSELAKIANKLNNKNCFLCVVCNLEDDLDLSDMEYMDILIFQLERLFEETKKRGLELDESILKSLSSWFGARVEEINKSIKVDGGFEITSEVKSPTLLNYFSLFSFTAKLKASINGSKENAYKIRTTFKNNFTDFSRKFNEFVEHVNMALRKQGIAQEILFIVDGLEKTSTMDIRKKIILEETNHFRQIKANTIFTLPIELMQQRELLRSFSTVVSFPFVKIREKNGDIVNEAVQRFEDFVKRRIDVSLFETPEVIKKAILFSGGSPRELLRILQYLNMYSDEDNDKFLMKDLDKAIKKLAAETAQYISEKDLEKLKKLKNANELGEPIAFDETWQDLLEKLIILEYNDGTYKRVSPIVEASALYQFYVK